MKTTTILFHEIKENDKPEINNLNKYIGKEGIWALFAKESDGYICLNVGKSKNIGSEILYDISCMHYLDIRKGDYEYYNQYGEDCDITWNSGFTQEYLYPNIYKRYEEFAFILISNISESLTEKEFAWASHAKYWRNGKVYTQKHEGLYEKNKKANCGDYKCIEKIDSLNYVLDSYVTK